MNARALAELSAPTTAHVIASAIAGRGCTHVFGLMGDGNMHLFAALRADDVELVEVRHESAAVAMAEGYSWAQGDVGFCSVTHGPGLTHTSTSLVVAARNHSAVVLIVGETPDDYQGAQHLDQEAFVAGCEAPYRRLRLGEDPAAAIDEVCEMALALRRPIVLGVAADLLRTPAGSAWAPEPRRHGRSAPSDEDNELAALEILAALRSAQRPVLIAGRGARGPVAAGAMRELADHFGAALATTMPAKGLFRGHAADLGMAGGLASPTASRILRRADLVIAVGSSLDRGTTSSGRLFRDARIVQLVDAESGRSAADNVTTLRGDAAATMKLAAAKLTAPIQGRPTWCGPIPPPAVCWQEDLDTYSPPTVPGTLDPRRALSVLNQRIPEDAIVIAGNGHCTGFTTTFIDAPPAGGWFTAQGFGSIGQAFTTAVGLALGAPGRKVVCLEGDAAFMMHAQELDTAARAGADVTLVVINDQALGTEYQRLAAEAGEVTASLALVATPDLAALAGALGARGYTVTDQAHLAEVSEAALGPGLAVIDLRTDRSVLASHMRWLGHGDRTPNTSRTLTAGVDGTRPGED